MCASTQTQQGASPTCEAPTCILPYWIFQILWSLSAVALGCYNRCLRHGLAGCRSDYLVNVRETTPFRWFRFPSHYSSLHAPSSITLPIHCKINGRKPIFLPETVTENSHTFGAKSSAHYSMLHKWLKLSYTSKNTQNMETL